MFFNQIREGAPDPVFGLAERFRSDVREHKVDLVVGIYKNEQLEAPLFPSVLKAKKAILTQDVLADYLPIDGFPSFSEEVGKLLFGNGNWERYHGNIYAAQSIGGTGAIRVAAELLAQEGAKVVYVPDPTWVNHRQILERVGCRVATYPYYNREKRSFDCRAMCDQLETLPENVVVILHAACHNPSGRDPTLEEWTRLSRIFKAKKLVPFFDCAYQGLGGGLQKDAEAVRLFLNEGHEMIVAYSCSKNFSLYCQRIGALFMIGENNAIKGRVGSQIKRIIRTLYSNPPAHGARIVVEILKNSRLREEWERGLEEVRHRVISTQGDLIRRLQSGAKRTDFNYLQNHNGLFMFIDLTKRQVGRLIEEFAVYLLDNGRINVAGLTQQNIDYVVNSILTVVEP